MKAAAEAVFFIPVRSSADFKPRQPPSSEIFNINKSSPNFSIYFPDPSSSDIGSNGGREWSKHDDADRCNGPTK